MVNFLGQNDFSYGEFARMARNIVLKFMRGCMGDLMLQRQVYGKGSWRRYVLRLNVDDFEKQLRSACA